MARRVCFQIFLGVNCPLSLFQGRSGLLICTTRMQMCPSPWQRCWCDGPKNVSTKLCVGCLFRAAHGICYNVNCALNFPVDRSPFASRVQLQKVSKWPGSSPYPQARQQRKADHRWHLAGNLSHCAFDWVCDWRILSLLVWYFHGIIWKWLTQQYNESFVKTGAIYM